MNRGRFAPVLFGWGLVVFCFLGSAGEAQPSSPATGAGAATPEAVSHAFTAESQFDANSIGAAYDRLKSNPKSPSTVGGETAQAASSQLVGGKLLGRFVLSLLVVVGFIFLVAQGLRRWGRGSLLNTPGPLKVLARQSLSNRSTVYIVSALDRLLVVGENNSQLTILSEFSDPAENVDLREQWGWEKGPTNRGGGLFTPGNTPFAPSLQGHMRDLESEISRLKEGQTR